MFQLRIPPCILTWFRALEGEGKPATLTGNACTFHPNAPVHCLYQLLTYEQAESCTAYRAVHIAFKPHETFKKVLLLYQWHTQSMILYIDRYLFLVHIHSDF